MSPFDLKKFITLFLILAMLASSLVFIFSRSFLNNPKITIIPNNQSASAAPQNAFSNGFNVPDTDVNPSGSAGQQISTATSSNNLTSILADNLTTGFLSANPNGPQTIDGQTGLIPPDATSVTRQVIQGYNWSTFKIPNWDEDVPASNIITASSSSQNDLANYSNAFSNIVNKYLILSNPEAILNAAISQNDPRSSFASAENVLNQAIQETLNTPVPEPASDLHESFLKLLVYQRNAVREGGNSLIDPLRSSLVFNAESQNYDDAVQGFQGQAQKFSSLLSKSSDRNKFLSFVDNLLGINEAHAQFVPVNDAFLTAVQQAHNIWQVLEAIARQVLINFLVDFMQKKVVSFVQGSGAPKFVTNWVGFLGRSFAQGAGASRAQIIPGLDPSFSGLINSALQPPAGLIKSDISKYVNPTQFYQNFANGNWAAFGALLKPDNNFFGALLDAHDIQLAQAASAQQAAQSKAVANQGFLGTGFSLGEAQSCNSPTPLSIQYSTSNPDGQTAALNWLNDQINSYAKRGYTVTKTPTCDDSGGTCSAEVCAASSLTKENITTPGSLVSNLVGKATGSNVDLVVNAKSIEALAATVATSLLSQILTSSLLGSGHLSVPTTPPPPTVPPTTTLSCSPPYRSASVGSSTTLTASGGNGSIDNLVPPVYNWSAPGGTPPSGTGSSFSVSYDGVGAKIVTITSGGQSATCNITVTAGTSGIGPGPTGTGTGPTSGACSGLSGSALVACENHGSGAGNY